MVWQLTHGLVKECSVFNLEFRYNAFYCTAWGLVSAVDNFFHICVGLFCYIAEGVQDGIEVIYIIAAL